LTLKGFSAHWLTEHWQTALMGTNKNQLLVFKRVGRKSNAARHIIKAAPARLAGKLSDYQQEQKKRRVLLASHC
jgi:hypothetical protein